MTGENDSKDELKKLIYDLMYRGMMFGFAFGLLVSGMSTIPDSIEIVGLRTTMVGITVLMIACIAALSTYVSGKEEKLRDEYDFDAIAERGNINDAVDEYVEGNIDVEELEARLEEVDEDELEERELVTEKR